MLPVRNIDLCRQILFLVTFYNNQIRECNYSIKYLGLHLDRKLTWKPHIFVKTKQINLKLKELYLLLNRKSRLSLEDKILQDKQV